MDLWVLQVALTRTFRDPPKMSLQNFKKVEKSWKEMIKEQKGAPKWKH